MRWVRPIAILPALWCVWANAQCVARCAGAPCHQDAAPSTLPPCHRHSSPAPDAAPKACALPVYLVEARHLPVLHGVPAVAIPAAALPSLAVVYHRAAPPIEPAANGGPPVSLVLRV